MFFFFFFFSGVKITVAPGPRYNALPEHEEHQRFRCVQWELRRETEEVASVLYFEFQNRVDVYGRQLFVIYRKLALQNIQTSLS